MALEGKSLRGGKNGAAATHPGTETTETETETETETTTSAGPLDQRAQGWNTPCGALTHNPPHSDIGPLQH